MNVLLVNKYAPPDPSPTAGLLGDLVAALEADGDTVRIVAATADYRKRKAKGIARWCSELVALLKICSGLLTGPRPDAIIAFSSPPCLVLFTAIAATFRRCRLIHWCLDLYPEIAVALGALPKPLARLIAPLMLQAYHRCERVVALDSDMQQRLRNYGIKSDLLLPWVPGDSIKPPPHLPQNSPDDKLIMLYSGNLGRAHEWRTVVDAMAIMDKDNLPVQLSFQGDGPQYASASEYAARLGLNNCKFLSYVENEQLVASLLASDVLVATQNPATIGCLWPSKLALAAALPRPILWVGPTDSAVAKMLTSDPANGIFAPSQALEIVAWCKQALATKKSLPAAEYNSRQINSSIQDTKSAAIAQWRGWLQT